jgi:hypothetical protein
MYNYPVACAFVDHPAQHACEVGGSCAALNSSTVRCTRLNRLARSEWDLYRVPKNNSGGGGSVWVSGSSRAPYGHTACQGFRSLTTRPRNPAPALATNIASEILTGKAFKRAADEFQHAVPAPPASNMYGNVTDIFASHQHPLRADPHAMVYTDGSVIQSKLKELETTGSKRIRLETTTATIAGAGICVPAALRIARCW